MSGYDCLNKTRFSSRRKVDSELAATTSVGSVLQMCGAATAKARLPTVDTASLARARVKSEVISSRHTPRAGGRRARPGCGGAGRGTGVPAGDRACRRGAAARPPRRCCRPPGPTRGPRRAAEAGREARRCRRAWATRPSAWRRSGLIGHSSPNEATRRPSLPSSHEPHHTKRSRRDHVSAQPATSCF